MRREWPYVDSSATIDEKLKTAFDDLHRTFERIEALGLADLDFLCFAVTLSIKCAEIKQTAVAALEANKGCDKNGKSGKDDKRNPYLN